MTSVIDMVKSVVATRWRIILALFIVEIAAIIIVSNLPFFPGEQGAYQQQYNNIKPTLNEDAVGQVASIFANNFRVSIIELIPLIGPIFYGISIYETARIVEVIGAVNQVGAQATLETLFFLPSTWLELPAYSIAVTESLFFVYGLRQGAKTLIPEIPLLFVSIGMAAVTLIVAAIVEVTEIQIEQATTTSGGAPTAYAGLVFLTWVPFVFIFWGAVRFWRASLRDAPKNTGQPAQQAEAAILEGPVVITPGVVHYCAKCGRMYTGSPKFCAGCGNPLPQQSPPL